MSPRKAHQAATRARTARVLRRHGVQDARTARPVIQWRGAGCRCALLRVYLTPQGWVLDGEDFRESVPRWIDRINPDGTATLDDGTPLTLDAYRAGRWAAFDRREIAGVQRLLPLDVEAWGGARFEVGCRHGQTRCDLADLADDAREVRHARRAVSRAVDVVG